MGFSFIGLGISLALLFIGGVIIYNCCFRKKKTTDQGLSENNRQDVVTGTEPGYPPSSQPMMAPYPAPVGWNLNPDVSAPKSAPYPTGDLPGTAPYPTGGPEGAPFPTAGNLTAPGSGWVETTHPSAPPPPYSSSAPPYPN
ncbi:unnamed protein product [Hymenolepis diminuta]|uniref:Protein shisa-5 n=1 Tax=Hymenolepis diminuta TaxID=6216 RepID=A0A0R3SVW4_HYMDI|nr:unnamed protein product [Hymenolepis diminuta]VUZ57723.1 unnamed protein product [Hymenolepis diminuta]